VTGTNHLLVEVHLDHALDRVSDMDQLKELQQRRHTSRLLMLRRLILPHLLRRDPESRPDMAIAHRLKQHDEDFLDRLLDACAGPAGISLEGLDSLEGVPVGVDERESGVEGDEELKRFEGFGFSRGGRRDGSGVAFGCCRLGGGEFGGGWDGERCRYWESELYQAERTVGLAVMRKRRTKDKAD
jgi:hypothetical protein